MRLRWPTSAAVVALALLAGAARVSFGEEPPWSTKDLAQKAQVVVEPAFPDVDFIVLAPYGRGEVAGYNGLAEQDVLRAMEDVKKA